MLGWASFLAVVLGWGSSFFGIRIALEGFTPLGLVGVRNLAAATVLLLAARLRGESWPDRKETLRVATLGLLLVGAPNFFATQGQKYLSSGVGGLLNATISVWIVLLSARLEPPPRRVWGGVALGLCGVALLLLPGQSHRISLLGVGCMMLSTFSFAWAALRFRQTPSNAGFLSTLALQMGAAGAVCTLAALLFGGVLSATPTSRALGGLAYLVAGPSLVAYAAFATLSRLWHPSRFGIYAVLTPVVAVILGVAFLGEPFTGRMAAAMAVILGGVALVQIR